VGGGLEHNLPFRQPECLQHHELNIITITPVTTCTALTQDDLARQETAVPDTIVFAYGIPTVYGDFQAAPSVFVENDASL
jgi:hypothetical protein